MPGSLCSRYPAFLFLRSSRLHPRLWLPDYQSLLGRRRRHGFALWDREEVVVGVNREALTFEVRRERVGDSWAWGFQGRWTGHPRYCTAEHCEGQLVHAGCVAIFLANVTRAVVSGPSRTTATFAAIACTSAPVELHCVGLHVPKWARGLK
jgi:hypothetical protein